MITGIIERLRALPELKVVGGAADFQQAAASNPKATPSVFVYSLAEEPAPSDVANLVLQRVAVTVAVVLVVRNVADAQGSAAGHDMETLRKAVKASLLGWQPAEEHDPLERGPSNLLLFKDSYMWWQDVYATAFYDRSVL